ncbi:MAG: hypothetical protein COB41_08830 [Proteobacteria bacterium]|nr:MAG: hypothetical protein COB41_08830 [Pseudomonadota bacterium]
MAKHKRVSFSKKNLVLDEIDHYYRNIEASTRLYFSSSNPTSDEVFVGRTKTEIEYELEVVSVENENLVALNLLASIEAAFRVDYLQRCYKKKKDSLSLALRTIHDIKGSHASLEDDIFTAWKDNTSSSSAVISDLKGAFKYRHWLAHGRYWEPKLGKKYDYFSVFILAQTVFNSFPFEGVNA